MPDTPKTSDKSLKVCVTCDVFQENDRLAAENAALKRPLEVNGFKVEGMMAVGKELTRLTAEVAAAYKKGYLQALSDFAWWKDGTQYVGCGVKTLKQAQEDFEKGETHATEKTDH